MGKVSIIVGVVAALVIVAVIVVIVVVFVLGGIDTSPITEVTETKVVSKADGATFGITDDYYYMYTTSGSGLTIAHTYALTYIGGETKTFTYTSEDKKQFGSYVNEMTAYYQDNTVTDKKALTFFNPFDAEIAVAALTIDGSSPSFYNEDEFTTNKDSVYSFYYRDSGNTFVKSSFTITQTGSGNEKLTNRFASSPSKYHDYFVTYDQDRTADKKPTTYSVWDKSDKAAFEKQTAEEGLNVSLNEDSTSYVNEWWLGMKQLWKQSDADTYWLTEYFATEKLWTAALSAASGYTLGSPSSSARAWMIRNNADGTQTKDTPDSYMLKNWDDGLTSFEFKNADTKLVSGVSIPYTAKWAKVTYLTDTTTSYEIQIFN